MNQQKQNAKQIFLLPLTRGGEVGGASGVDA